LTMKENRQAIKDGWCPNCEPDKMTPMVEECEGCKIKPRDDNFTESANKGYTQSCTWTVRFRNKGRMGIND